MTTFETLVVYPLAILGAVNVLAMLAMAVWVCRQERCKDRRAVPLAPRDVVVSITADTTKFEAAMRQAAKNIRPESWGA